MTKHYKLKHKDYVEKISLKAMDKAKKAVMFEYLMADVDAIFPIFTTSSNPAAQAGEGVAGGRFGNFEREGNGGETRRPFRERPPYTDLDDPAVLMNKLNQFEIDYDSL